MDPEVMGSDPIRVIYILYNMAVFSLERLLPGDGSAKY